jgi:peptidoglycan/xylan/chitin deacetylase (PgdA/CDA1 family)
MPSSIATLGTRSLLRGLAPLVLASLLSAAACSTGTPDAAPAKSGSSSCEAGEDACGSFVCDLPADAGATTSSEVELADGGAEEKDVGAPVFVSLTFDDTFADQYVLLDILGSVGMQATLYVNSARIGERTYLTAEQLGELARAGHEIAGHTVTHPTLPTVDAAEQKRQICDDRVSLMQRGFVVKNFAYPHGAFTPETQAIVRACGYNSARVVGGLGCSDCPGGEPGQPLALGDFDKLAVRSPTSIKCNATLADLQREVTTAERRGGGWVPMVFHHVCDNCGRNAVSPALLREFVSWLAARRARGTVTRTVDQMVGGELAAPVPGPPPSAPVARTGNLLANPGFEEPDPTTDQLGRCWVKGGEGSNEFAFGRTSDAHSGAFAEWIEVSRFIDGARRIYSRQDLGYCAPVVQPHRRYRAGAWYKGTASPRFTAYYRTPSGFWRYWTTSKPLPVSNDWRVETFDLPETPEDAGAVSISLTLVSEGRITMDDLSLVAADE